MTILVNSFNSPTKLVSVLVSSAIGPQLLEHFSPLGLILSTAQKRAIWVLSFVSHEEWQECLSSTSLFKNDFKVM